MIDRGTHSGLWCGFASRKHQPVEAQNYAHNTVYSADSDSCGALLCNQPLECMGWSDGSGRHNYFSLIFYLDFIEESTATPARKTCQIRVPLVSGYVFTRCLGGG